MEKRITRFEKAPNYTQHYINGLYGGIDVMGEFVMNFYNENIELPAPRSITYDGDGNLVASEFTEINPKILDENTSVLSTVRTVQTSIIMTYSKAEEIYRWLESRLQPSDKKEEGNSQVSNEKEEEEK